MSLSVFVRTYVVIFLGAFNALEASCHKDVVLKSFNDVSMKFKECLKFQGSFKGVSMKF